MGDDPYQYNKLVADCTPGMSDRDVKKASKQQGRPKHPKGAKDFDLDITFRVNSKPVVSVPQLLCITGWLRGLRQAMHRK
jgi:hypothetical protein